MRTPSLVETWYCILIGAFTLQSVSLTTALAQGVAVNRANLEEVARHTAHNGRQISEKQEKEKSFSLGVAEIASLSNILQQVSQGDEVRIHLLNPCLELLTNVNHHRGQSGFENPPQHIHGARILKTRNITCPREVKRLIKTWQRFINTTLATGQVAPVIEHEPLHGLTILKNGRVLFETSIDWVSRNWVLPDRIAVEDQVDTSGWPVSFPQHQDEVEALGRTFVNYVPIPEDLLNQVTAVQEGFCPPWLIRSPFMTALRNTSISRTVLLWLAIFVPTSMFCWLARVARRRGR